MLPGVDCLVHGSVIVFSPPWSCHLWSSSPDRGYRDEWKARKSKSKQTKKRAGKQDETRQEPPAFKLQTVAYSSYKARPGTEQFHTGQLFTPPANPDVVMFCFKSSFVPSDDQ